MKQEIHGVNRTKHWRSFSYEFSLHQDVKPGQYITHVLSQRSAETMSIDAAWLFLSVMSMISVNGLQRG